MKISDREREMQYKAVIFDFDYTLGDSTDGIVLSSNYALEKMGFIDITVQIQYNKA